MNLRELFTTEDISFTTLKHDLFNILTGLSQNTLADKTDMEIKEKESKISLFIFYKRLMVMGQFVAGMTEETFTERMKIFVKNVYEVTLQEYSEECSKLIGTRVTMQLSEKGNNPHAAAAAGYNYIVFYDNIQKMVDEDATRIVGYLISDNIFTNNKLHDLEQLKTSLNSYEFWMFSLVDSLRVQRRISDTIHELVHIKQHSKQSRSTVYKDNKTGEFKTKGTEYRSKVEPNNEKFRDAVFKNYDNNIEKHKIYSSALQEIPAYAHNAAIDIIDELHFGSSGAINKNTTEALRALIKIIKNLHMGPNSLYDADFVRFTSSTFEYYSETFNKPGDKKLYPVYKRFIKILHQELVNYAQHWIDKIKANGTMTEGLRVDVPNEEWLQGKRNRAIKNGPDDYGVPYHDSTTAWISDGPVRLPVSLLTTLPGMRGEQKRVRKDDLEWLTNHMKETGKLPTSDNGREYAPFVMVMYDGSAWVNEGNHRIMAAAALGWDELPVELRYYDGGERVEDSPLYPAKIGLK